MLLRAEKNPALYRAHYGKRSNVESTYSSMKRKIAGHLVSRNAIAQENEALAVAIVHNLQVVARVARLLRLDVRFKR